MLIILFLLGVLMMMGLLAAFWFTKTSKDMPKNWFEWKTEFSYQSIGIMGLIDDFTNRSKNRVALYKQPGRVVVITGGNRGIGLRIVQKLLACDMTVIMGVRDPQGTEKIVGNLVDLKTCGGQLVCEKLDVGHMKSVKEFAQRIQSKYNKIDILINNAGIMFAPYNVTSESYESHLAVNYLGHFLLTHLLMPQLKAAGTPTQNARIINVSSCAHLLGRINYDDINGFKYYYPGSAYSQSKLAQILSTRHLQTLLADSQAHVQVNAVHPGIVDTDLFEYSATTSVPFFKKLFFKTPEQGSRTVVFAAIDPSVEGKGGMYYSNCSKGSIHPAAMIPAKCEKLFNYSCELLNINDYGSGK